MESKQQLFVENNLFNNIETALKHFNLLNEKQQKEFIDNFAESYEHQERFVKFVELLTPEQRREFGIYYYHFAGDATVIGHQEWKHLVAPDVEEVFFRDCPTLVKIHALNAKIVYIDNCPRTQLVVASNAAVVSVAHCPRLQALHVPKAAEVSVADCQSLKKLYFPKAKKVDVTCLERLQKLDASNAESIDVRGCPLTQLDASNAKKVVVRDCPLTQLDAPNAKKVTVADCSMLNKLDAPNAEDVFVADCSMLNKLDAPNAKEVDVINCSMLNKLYASKAEEVYVERCPLEELRAPNAKEVKVKDCRNLTREDIIRGMLGADHEEQIYELLNQNLPLEAIVNDIFYKRFENSIIEMINLPELRANDIKNELNNIVQKARPKVEGYKKLFAKMMHKKTDQNSATGKYIQLKLDLKKEITGFLSFKKIKDFVDQYVSQQKIEKLNQGVLDPSFSSSLDRSFVELLNKSSVEELLNLSSSHPFNLKDYGL
jgi:hypothetical protein